MIFIFQIYIIPLNGASSPKPLTSEQQGATRNPVFSPDGTKVAWLELATDGYESDQTLITVYDLRTDVRYSLDFRESKSDSLHAIRWDRSPDSITVSRIFRYYCQLSGPFVRFSSLRMERTFTSLLEIKHESRCT